MLTAPRLESELKDLPNLSLLWSKVGQILREERTQREEFYKWMDEDMKAEFINGRVVMHSPASDGHNDAVKGLLKIADTYAILKGLGKLQAEKALIALTRNDYEPDLAFWKKETADTFTKLTNVYPAPDFIVEVLSKDSKKRDRVIKFKDYAAHGITEYWIIDPIQQTVEQYILTDPDMEDYVLWKKATVSDNIESQVITGFNIPVKAIFDAQTNIETIQRILQNVL